MSRDLVLEGVDASRRAAWAQKYAADERIAELERELAVLKREGDRLQSLLDECTTECKVGREARRTERAGSRVLRLMSDGRARSRNEICHQVRGSRIATWAILHELIMEGALLPAAGRNGRQLWVLAELDE